MNGDEQKPMATTPVPEAMPSVSGQFIRRELNGATFLTLEHVAHMVLVVAVAALLASGVMSLLAMWTGGRATDLPLLLGGAQQVEALAAVSIAAALLVIVPLLAVLDRRTRAEWMKRHGYSGRVAYKVPLYAALGSAAAVKVGIAVTLVSVVLSSLVQIGVPNAQIGTMYLTQFLPAVIAGVIFGYTSWYLFKLAKGRDAGRQFSLVMAGASAVVVLALLITSITVLHSNTIKSNSTTPSLEELFNY